MADLSFDAVVVGGGCKGLSTAMYLAKYGNMSVGVFEETHELGGGLAGEQIAPGIQCNTHAGGHQWWYYGTIIKEDFPELYEEGLELLPIGSNNIFVFDDESCVTLYAGEADPDGSKSAAEIAKFSRKDADTFLRIREVYLKYMQVAQLEEAYSVAKPIGVPGPMAKSFLHPEVIKAGLDPELMMSKNAFEVADHFYESLEAKLMILRQGFFLDEVGGGLMAMTGIYSMSGYHFAAGGVHNLAHAMQRVLSKYGVKTYTSHPVEKAIIENGIAKGIQLKDGTRVEAKKMVISTLSPQQLCYDLIGVDNLSSEFVKKIDGIESGGSCAAILTWAFSEHPVMKCKKFNPDVYGESMAKSVNFFSLGPKNLESLRETERIRKNFTTPGYKVPNLPLLNLNTDPDHARLTRDPKVALWNSLVPLPPAWAQTEEYWIKFQNEYPEWQMKELQKYIDNIGWDKVVGLLVRTPYWIAKHFSNMVPSGNVNIIDPTPTQIGSYRPIPELAQHKTPIENLYATGSAFGSWGMSSFCASYTCYKVISDAYGLSMPWKEKGRPY